MDHIVHPAALVNHRLSYRNLFEPNVLGTAELIRLALTERLKRFDYVSSVAVPHMSPDLAHGPESMDVRIGAPEMPLLDMYATGYGASKWAGEVMLREAHEKFGLPANVFRADMIMPHASYRAQILLRARPQWRTPAGALRRTAGRLYCSRHAPDWREAL